MKLAEDGYFIPQKKKEGVLREQNSNISPNPRASGFRNLLPLCVKHRICGYFCGWGGAAGAHSIE